MAVMVIFAVIANRKLKHATEKPDTFQNIIELIVEKLDGMVDSTMGKWAPRFVNYISTIFIFILMSNISGLFGLRPPTADYGTTLALALITFFMIRFNKAKHQSLKEIWTGMCSPLPPWLPLWAPINIISAAGHAVAITPSKPYTSAMITVPDNTFANRRSDNEIGIAICFPEPSRRMYSVCSQ